MFLAGKVSEHSKIYDIKLKNWLIRVLHRIGQINQLWKLEVSLAGFTSLHFIERQIFILDTGHHLKSNPTDKKVTCLNSHLSIKKQFEIAYHFFITIFL